MIENDNTYAKCCILYSKDVYIGVTQSKYILVCVCVCVRAFVRVRAHVRAYVHTCVRLCVCAFWSIQMEHTNVHTGLCFGSCRISENVHPFRIC